MVRFVSRQNSTRKEPFMDTIVKFGKKGKVKRAKAVEVQKLQEYGALAIDAKAALIQELIPLGLMHMYDGSH
jgi:hypothetical protein